ncbi:MAG: outer membrane beta-barrel protein [Phaeodactylibacter sp.]|nr:outer membrane beta-barrel protein [Phaeodactylibacter sp.]MCB9291601.1 outer membrane beta-barrel protein [Lewinellaceae bacterium]
MSHHDKFWEKFGQKIRQHNPEGDPAGEWRAMEQLLEGAARPSQKRKKRIAALILAAAAMGYLAGAWLGLPQKQTPVGAFPIPLERSAGDGQASSPDTYPLPPDTGRKEKARPAVAALPETRLPALPGHPAAGEVSAIPARQLPPALAAGQGEGETAARPAPAEGRMGSVPVSRSPWAALPYLPALSGRLDSQPPPLPADSRRYAPAKKEGRRLYGGLLLGANLPIINFREGLQAPYPFAGLFAGLQLTPRWSVQAETHLKYVAGFYSSYEQSARIETSNGNFFDQESRGTAVKNYLAIEAPLLAKYRIAPDWSLLAGVRPALLLEGFSWPAAQDEEVSANITSGSGQSNAGPGREPELRKFDLGLSGGVEWAWSRRWALSARFTHGLLDLSPDAAFRAQNRQFNSDLQLSVRYKF